MMDSEHAGFKDSDSLTMWVRYFLYAQVIIALISLVSNFMEYQLLTDFKNGVYTSRQMAVADGEANDRRQQLIAIVELSVLILSGIFILKWIYRVNYNARQLGAKDMEFTPGWSIGWYFVPIALLWKPYQAMKEIWKASHSPDDWPTASVGGILPWWWFLWLANGFLGQLAFRFARGAEEIDQLKTVNILVQLSEIVSIPLSLVTMTIIVKIYKAQKKHAAIGMA